MRIPRPYWKLDELERRGRRRLMITLAIGYALGWVEGWVAGVRRWS